MHQPTHQTLLTPLQPQLALPLPQQQEQEHRELSGSYTWHAEFGIQLVQSDLSSIEYTEVVRKKVSNETFSSSLSEELETTVVTDTDSLVIDAATRFPSPVPSPEPTPIPTPAYCLPGYFARVGKGVARARQVDVGDNGSSSSISSTSTSTTSTGSFVWVGPHDTRSDASRYNCTACPAGKPSSSPPGSYNCTDCAAGKYAAGEGSPSCSECPAGKTNNEVGVTYCTACAAGWAPSPRCAAHASSSGTR